MTDNLTDYYHKVVDCQWACPAHTPVPEYIRLIKEGRYTEAYIVNRESNVFPGILGRVCDAPCESACRRGRVDAEPVGICRLKRVTADFAGDFAHMLPQKAQHRNGKRIALLGAGPAALTVANDLLPLGYECVIFDREDKPGGAMYTQVPRFRLPEAVLEQETNVILALGAETRFGEEVRSLKGVLAEGFDAVVVATGAIDGKPLCLPGLEQAPPATIVLATDFLAGVAHGTQHRFTDDVLIIGGGNTAMDCSRTALRLGARKVYAIAPESYEEMRAFPIEKHDAKSEGVEIVNNLLPLAYELKNGALVGVRFAKLEKCYDSQGRWNPVRTSEPEVVVACSTVICAIGQNVNLNFIEPELGIGITRSADGSDARVIIDPVSYQSQHPQVFFAGDAAIGPRNIIWAVATGHSVALSVHLFCQGKDPLRDRPKDQMHLTSQKIAMNQWGYDNKFYDQKRMDVLRQPVAESLRALTLESEIGYDIKLALKEAERCLDCDMQTVFAADLCIECDSCVDICPVNCLTIAEPAPTTELRLSAPRMNLSQGLLQADVPQTHRWMVKDENLCLHCGLCAERCPTGAWDMQKSSLQHLSGSLSPCQQKRA